MIANIRRPQVSQETILARIEGVQNLYRDGVCAEYLWGYCATGNIVTPFDRDKFQLVLREWDEATAVFRRDCPYPSDRDKVMYDCIRKLNCWLQQVA